MTSCWERLDEETSEAHVADGFLLVICDKDKTNMVFISSTDLNRYRRKEIPNISPVNAIIECNVKIDQFVYYKIVC